MVEKLIDSIYILMTSLVFVLATSALHIDSLPSYGYNLVSDREKLLIMKKHSRLKMFFKKGKLRISIK